MPPFRLGLAGRRYVGDGNTAKVVSHYSFGMLAGFGHSVSFSRLRGELQENGWMVGAFGDVGGTSLRGRGVDSNSVFKSSLSGRGREWSTGGSAVGASLVATLFFRRNSSGPPFDQSPAAPSLSDHNEGNDG